MLRGTGFDGKNQLSTFLCILKRLSSRVLQDEVVWTSYTGDEHPDEESSYVVTGAGSACANGVYKYAGRIPESEVPYYCHQGDSQLILYRSRMTHGAKMALQSWCIADREKLSKTQGNFYCAYSESLVPPAAADWSNEKCVGELPCPRVSKPRTDGQTDETKTIALCCDGSEYSPLSFADNAQSRLQLAGDCSIFTQAPMDVMPGGVARWLDSCVQVIEMSDELPFQLQDHQHAKGSSGKDILNRMSKDTGDQQLQWVEVLDSTLCSLSLRTDAASASCESQMFVQGANKGGLRSMPKVAA